MPLWIKQVEGDVPGTAFLDDSTQVTEESDIINDGLKRGTGKFKHIVLVPQPSDDAQDPLNWPTWKKELFFANLVWGSVMTGVIGHLINSGFKSIATQWKLPVNEVSSTNAWLNFATAIYTLVQGALATKYGRRPVFVSASLFQVAATIWSARSNGYNSFLASRVLSGLGMAPYQGLAGASIADVFFAHERGIRVAIWGLGIGAAINITPMINGTLIARSPDGWRTCFYIAFGIFCAHFIAVLAFFPESAYHREKVPTSEQTASVEGEKYQGDAEFVENASKESVNLSRSTRPPKTFVQELSLHSYTGKDNFWQLMLRPWRFWASPIVWFAIFCYGFVLSLLVVLSVINSTTFALPPYFFTAREVGFTSAGPLIGSFIGAYCAGRLVDYSTVWFARRNNGIYEPESRLLPNAIGLFLVCGGIGAWGGTVVLDPHWIVPCVLYGIIQFGQKFVGTASATYLVDCHKGNTAETFAVLQFSKDLLLYGCSKRFNGWVLEHGVRFMFSIVAGVCAFCILLAIPMYRYGKVVRAWCASKPEIFLTKD